MRESTPARHREAAPVVMLPNFNALLMNAALREAHRACCTAGHDTAPVEVMANVPEVEMA